LAPVEKMGATWVEKLTVPVTGGTSSGRMKSYLQLFAKNANSIVEIRNMERFFMVYIFNVNTKKDFNFKKRSLSLSF